MKIKRFLVEFSNGNFEVVSATNTNEAIDLAQTKQDEKGYASFFVNVWDCAIIPEE